MDAFSSEPYQGNLAAIVFDADELSRDAMQRVARHLNLSETVFMLRPESPEAHYRARIFTPRREVPFAGHPTIASCQAFAERGNLLSSPRFTIRQECGVGVVEVDVAVTAGHAMFTMTMNHAVSADAGLSRADGATLVGCDEAQLTEDPIEVCSAGLPWLVVRLESLNALKGSVPNQSAIAEAGLAHGAAGLTAYCLGADVPGCSVHSRSWGPAVGIAEDPTCGSGNAAVAIHLSKHAFGDRPAFSYRAEQGLEIGRRGILHLAVDRPDGGGEPRVRLGGHATTVAQGRISA